MYSIKVEEIFSSAHNLRGYKGKCEELHGHNWKIEVCIKSKTTDKIGMVEDFSCVKSSLRRILEGLDHKYLNALPYFKKVNPTSENIAKYIFTKLNPEFSRISSGTYWETQRASPT